MRELFRCEGRGAWSIGHGAWCLVPGAEERMGEGANAATNFLV